MLVAVRNDLRFALKYPRVRVVSKMLGIALLVFVLVGLFYWWPTWYAANKLTSEIDDRRQQIIYAKTSAGLANAANHATQHVAQIEKRLDAAVTQVALVQSLAALARRHNVRILSEAYEEGKPKDSYSPLVHELTIQAGYPALRSFLAGLQELPTFTVVLDTNIARISNSTSLKAQLRLVTYRRVGGHQP